MTTIAYRSGILAADTLVTANRARCGTVSKAWRTADGSLWAVAGKLACMEACRAWSETDRLDPAPKFDDSTLIHITPAGAVREWYGDGWCETDAEFFAWGSGDQFALGAMAMGADPKAAVGVAKRFDTGTGGDITVLTREA